MTHLESHRMDRKRLAALLALNLALGAGLALAMNRSGAAAPGAKPAWSADMAFVSAASAQAQPSPLPSTGVNRSRGQYLLVSGRLNGLSMHGIYILDMANQEMVALRWEKSQNNLITIGYRSMGEDIRVGGGGR